MGCLCVWSIARAQSIKLNEIQSSSQTNGTDIGGMGKKPKETTTGISTTKNVPSQIVSHSIRASKTVSEEALRQYLEARKSPLANYAELIVQSPYASTIIGICTIEEYSCSVNPYGTNNLWGLMSGGKLIRFVSIEAGIDAINNFLSKAENNGRRTVESFRGWYCASECTNWESTVISTKEKLESLN